VQARDRIAVEREALGLPDDRPVPVQVQRGDIGELLLGDAGPNPRSVEIVDAQAKRRVL